MDPFAGEIRLFAGTFAPINWHFCDGSLLNISQYQLLFALVGFTWGGDGHSTFGIPDLRGRIPVGSGQGVGLTLRTLAQTGGTSSVQITESNLPAHTHTLYASNAQANSATVGVGQGLAQPVTTASNKVVRYSPPAANPTQQNFDPASISTAYGSSYSHSNVMPYLAIQYIICLNGLYPNRP